MRKLPVCLVAVLVALAVVGCGNEDAGPDAAEGPAAPAPATTTAPAPADDVTSPEPSPGDGGTPGEACESFGGTDPVTSADPLAMSSLTGASMRIGQHDCYERFVFEMAGTGEPPGWRVAYVDPLTADGSGEPVELAGDATLEVVVRVWTVSEGEGAPTEIPPFTGPDDLVPAGYVALREARNLYAFEGVTQIGLGLDRERPYRASLLEGPPRLVVDVFTGG
ncbi:MAG TPA: hypothetical protein VFR74_02575 [Jiangellales bacterium]|nr:hypothetical protein [Jiangellales bacterium]